MINRSMFMMSASALICVCCGLSFADPATESQDGNETQKEEQVQKDEQQVEETVVKDEAKQEEAAAKDEVKQEETAAKDEAKQEETAAKDEAKQEEAAAKDEAKQEETAAKEEVKQEEKTADDAKKEEAKEESASPFTDPQEAIAFEEFNKFRVRHGLKPCEFNQNLQNIAKNHSNNMYRYRRMYHSGTRGVAENVFMGSSSGAFAIRVWSNSPGHRANMLGRYSRVGIARTGGYYTMVLQ